MRPLHSALLTIVLFYSGVHLHAEQEKAPPTIPTAALEPYTVSIVNEKLETMHLPRLRFSGRNTLQMDTLPNHLAVPTQGQCSARLQITNAPDFKVEFFAFPQSAFQYPLNDDSLNLYLEGLRLRHKPAQAFTIVEESAFNESGRAKFRILGQRAMTIRYSFQRKDLTIVCGENWIERDGTIYIVRVLAPAHAFRIQFEDVRAAFNSMSELK